MQQKGRSAEAQLGLPDYRGHSTAEKIAFAILVLFVVAATLGVFGDGPLSHATVASADGRMHIEYERFCRRQAPQTLDVTLPTQPDVDHVELRINAEYLQLVQITEIFPQPLQSTHQQTGVLRFATDGTGKPMAVRLHLEPLHAGLQEAHVTAGAAGEQTEAQFSQIVYP